MKKIWQKIIFYCLLTLCIVVCSSVKKTKLFWTLHFENFLDTLTKKISRTVLLLTARGPLVGH